MLEHIQAPSVTLLATAIDECGDNVATGTASPPLQLAKGDDDDSSGKKKEPKTKKSRRRGKSIIPEEYALFQNDPNPFNPETFIEYAVPEDAHVRLVIYNVMGQRVSTLVDGFRSVGYHQIIWDGRDSQGRLVSAGVYFYRLTAGEFSETKRMLLLK